MIWLAILLLCLGQIVIGIELFRLRRDLTLLANATKHLTGVVQKHDWRLYP